LKAQRVRRITDAKKEVKRVSKQLREAPAEDLSRLQEQLQEAKARLKFWVGWTGYERHPIAQSITDRD